jgi:hypothetical protein
VADAARRSTGKTTRNQTTCRFRLCFAPGTAEKAAQKEKLKKDLYDRRQNIISSLSSLAPVYRQVNRFTFFFQEKVRAFNTFFARKSLAPAY